MRRKQSVLIIAALAGITHFVSAVTLVPIASFNGWDGVHPYGDLMMGADGNLYGTAIGGGMSSTGVASNYGTIYEVNLQTGQLINLASFNETNGAQPEGGLIEDSQGNLYGTTMTGGSANEGTIFEYNRSTGNIISLASFTGSNGEQPTCTLYADAQGDLFGTATIAGANNGSSIFEWSAKNGLQTLFSGVPGYPRGGLIADSAGNLYGAGASGYFEFKPQSGTFSMLSVGNVGADGTLVMDAKGNLYGSAGGGVSEYSTTFRQSFDIVTFNASNGDGQDAIGRLLMDAAGNLFGTTGGSEQSIVDQSTLGNTVYEVTPTTVRGQPSGTLTVLATFNGTDGENPDAGLAVDSAGNLYGAALNGGEYGYGTIYEITDSGFVVPEPGALGLGFIVPLALIRRRRG
jgi:uncharacterized repeat protein (TIGR03803 family)